MKDFANKALRVLKIGFLLIMTFFCLTESDTVKACTSEAVMRCLNVVIPSLFAMMIISGLLVKSGILGAVSRFTGRILPVFLFGMFAGYPVGTKMLCSEYESGNISKRSAEIFSGICFGAGPAFIYGCISGQLYGARSAGYIILVSVCGADVILGLVILLWHKFRKKTVSEIRKNKITISGDMVTESVVSGGKSMAVICFSIIAFAVLDAFLRNTGIISLAGKLVSLLSGREKAVSEAMISAILDITAVNRLPAGDYTLLPFISALVSFGGICVLFQLSAVTSGKISILPVIVVRITASVISWIICRLIVPFMMTGESVAVSAMKVSTHKAESPVPSVLLVIMAFFVFREYEKQSAVGH